MTREEAIIILKCAMPNSNVGCGESDEEIEEAMTMTIEALEEEKQEKQELKQESVLDKIRAEIDTQDKWLAQAGYTAYNVDIAFNSIKRVIAESEGE